MPSHAINFAEQADNILIMKKGEIISQGSFIDVFNTLEFQEISNEFKKKMSEEHVEPENEEEE